jgi:hypothetical protein
MVKKKDLDKKFFYVQCGDWDAMTLALSHRQACLNTMTQAFESFGKHVELSDVIVSCECDADMNNDDDSIQAFLVDGILEELSHEY